MRDHESPTDGQGVEHCSYAACLRARRVVGRVGATRFPDREGLDNDVLVPSVDEHRHDMTEPER